MKTDFTQYSQFYLTVTLLLVSLAVSGCHKREPIAAQKELESTEITPETAAPPRPAPARAARPDADGFVTRLNGYWVPDKDSMLKNIKDSITAQKGAAALDPASLNMVTQVVEGVFAKMIVHLENGKSRIYSPKGVEESDITVLTWDAATGEFTLKTKSADGSVKSTTGKLEADQLTMSANRQSLVLRRFDRAEFDKRKQAIESDAQPEARPNIPARSPAPASPTP